MHLSKLSGMVITTGIPMLLVVLVLLIPHGSQSLPRQQEWSDEDLAKPWCRVRGGEQCCQGRNDECTVPLHGTFCYCDDFCNQTALDCCPDFWSFCMGVEPIWRIYTTTTARSDIPVDYGSGSIQQCYKNGRHYDVGETIKDNCNECTCLDEEPFSDQPSWACTKHTCLIQQDAIDSINFGSYGWRASNYSFLWGLTTETGYRNRLGTFQPSDRVFRMPGLKNHEKDELPDFFDSRQKWPGSISDIQDQGDCGSSWAFSTAALASDKFAIGSQGQIVERLSPQNLLSCVGVLNNSCNGGNIDQAWSYMRRPGSVTEDCYPYKAKIEACPIPRLGTPEICPSGRPFKQHMRFKMTPPHRIRDDEQTIKKQIYEHGPVQAIFRVKADFFLYKSGVYRNTISNSNLPGSYQISGSHSVRILGWGVDVSPNGQRTKYWLCANSWGPSWGENGYFRMLRGENESDIESFVISAWPRLDYRTHRYDSRGRLRRRRRRRSLDNDFVSEVLFGSSKE